MKHTKPAAKARAKRPRTAAKKRAVQRNRPLHKRMLLHPMSILVLLAAGVLMTGATAKSFAAQYTVTASILAPLPPSPAVVTSPISETHVTAQPLAVSGTCPPSSYVKLYQNNTFSGVAWCDAQATAYHITTDLSPGANVLMPRVFNITDNEGPAATPVTIWLDEAQVPAPPPPPAPPTDVKVTAIDQETFSKNNVLEVSTFPTVTGWAPPYSHIIVTFHSNPLTCATYADSNGNWSCTLDQPLSEGLHTVIITGTTPSGQTLSFASFKAHALSSKPSLHQTAANVVPFGIQTDYHYQVLTTAQAFSTSLSLSGGAAPYALTVSWGDGSESTMAHSDQAAFPIDHTYASPGSKTSYVIKLRATDSAGLSATLQLVAIVRGQALFPAGTTNSASRQSVVAGSQHWLWFLWPTYLIVVLMVVSFWLGERQEYLTILNRTKPTHRRA